ncbi:MAG: diguanylate cyclase [Aestuariibacter sp.]
MKKTRILILSSLLCCLLLPVANAVTVRTNLVPEGAREQYPLQLIEMAFSYFPDEDFVHVQHHENVNQARLKQMIADGQLDLMWAGTTPELETNFIPIRVPLFKGLLGHRIFIIRNGEQTKFSSIHNFTDLLRFKAGQGRSWGDTPILEYAGIDVVKPVNYPNLFYMLDGERFDYFPRAVHEPWPEVDSRPELNLAIERELMLVYPMPLYFFTNKDNHKLASILKEGLLKGIDEGKFDDIFFSNEDIKTAIEKTNMQNRRVFRINNPALSSDTPLDDKRLWIDINAI